MWCRHDACRRVAGRLVRLRAIALCRAGDCWCAQFLRFDDLNLFYVIDGLCTLVSVYWCVDGVFNIYRSCGSCICLHASCSSLCASVGSLSFVEGDISFLDGVLACVVVAHCLVGVFNIFCGCSSCIGFGLLSSICSAFVGVLFVFEGAFEFVASISSNVISGGLWFSGLAGQLQKSKDNDYYDYSRSSSLQASGFLLILTNRLSRVQVSTASSVACLRVWGRLPDRSDSRN